MGKKWDNTGIAYSVELWKECLRVLKPGGHLLAFGGSRTYHRMACAIEDAGFEIRDMVEWIFGSGFPKSLNISKELSKKTLIGLCTCVNHKDSLSLQYEKNNEQQDNIPNGNDDRLGFGDKIWIKGANHNEVETQIEDTVISANGIIPQEFSLLELQQNDNKKEQRLKEVCEPILQSGMCESIYEKEGYDIPSVRSRLEENKATGEGERQVLSNLSNKTKDGITGSSPDSVQDGREKHNGQSDMPLQELSQQDREDNGNGVGENKNDSKIREWNIDNRFICPECRKIKSDIGGSALKPSHEPICLARKPLGEKTVAENVLKYGTGGINIDECRVETDPQIDDMLRTVERKEREAPLWKDGSGFKNENNKLTGVPVSGRFPANLIHDGSPEVVEIFPHSTSGAMKKPYEYKNNGFSLGAPSGNTKTLCDASEGSAARFFKSCVFTPKDLFTNDILLCYLCTKETPKELWEKKNNHANNAEVGLLTTQVMEENIVQENAQTGLIEQCVHFVRSVGNLCEKCAISIVQEVVEIKNLDSKKEESQVIQDFISNYKKCILLQNLAYYAEIWVNIDTTPTTQNLWKLFGYVNLVITNYIQEIKKSEQAIFIYQAKTSPTERNMGCDELEEKHFQMRPFAEEGCDQSVLKNRMNSKVGRNNHPTVKPIALMKYLVKLITPPNGLVYDPFAGSGSTLIACKMEGFNYIGSELQPEYCEIAEARIKSIIINPQLTLL